MAFACRLCRVSVAASTGCSVCDPLRALLVVVGEGEDDRPSLSGTAAENVAMLKKQLVNCKEKLAVQPDSTIQEARLLKISNTMAKVLETARKLLADGMAVMETMSFAEKKELFVVWYSDLAPAYRNAVREAFADYEASISKPLPPEVQLS
jgi:hypothetical protein